MSLNNVLKVPISLIFFSEDKNGQGYDTDGSKRNSRLVVNGNRQKSKSADELRDNGDKTDSSSAGPSPKHVAGRQNSGVIQRLRHHHRHLSMAQKTHTFFAILKARWRSKERHKSKDKDGGGNAESDYAADYSSEHSKSSSATQSPARHYLSHPGEQKKKSKHRKLCL